MTTNLLFFSVLIIFISVVFLVIYACFRYWFIIVVVVVITIFPSCLILVVMYFRSQCVCVLYDGYVHMRDKVKKAGGVSFNSTVPLTKCSEKMAQLILHEYSIHLSALIFHK